MSRKQVKFYFKVRHISASLRAYFVLDNIMMRVFKSTLLNCKYFGGYSNKIVSNSDILCKIVCSSI